MNYIFTEQRASTIVAYTHVCVLESQRLWAKSGTRQLCFSTPRARWFSKSTCRETWRWMQCCVKRKKKLKISVGWMRKGRYIYLHTMWCVSSAVAIYQLDDDTECKNCTGYMALADQCVSCSITLSGFGISRQVLEETLNDHQWCADGYITKRDSCRKWRHIPRQTKCRYAGSMTNTLG
jgi:hypothetical protein